MPRLGARFWTLSQILQKMFVVIISKDKEQEDRMEQEFEGTVQYDTGQRTGRWLEGTGYILPRIHGKDKGQKDGMDQEFEGTGYILPHIHKMTFTLKIQYDRPFYLSHILPDNIAARDKRHLYLTNQVESIQVKELVTLCYAVCQVAAGDQLEA
ncbi:hypothetical protein BDN72DRAFT_947367 [Pluteus cervinus]|uniref:Uncharacterized protein n=1 Tax=Pluteus cervinus TaxID=181527 RepID=A0ACD3A0I2_9AGAR|nr:hypothetical protein BDN72DRAFT_947367 [Pluteus cervinus]